MGNTNSFPITEYSDTSGNLTTNFKQLVAQQPSNSLKVIIKNTALTDSNKAQINAILDSTNSGTAGPIEMTGTSKYTGSISEVLQVNTTDARKDKIAFVVNTAATATEANTLLGKTLNTTIDFQAGLKDDLLATNNAKTDGFTKMDGGNAVLTLQHLLP